MTRNNIFLVFQPHTVACRHRALRPVRVHTSRRGAASFPRASWSPAGNPMRDAFERARTGRLTSAVARCLWLVLHLYFTIRSLGRSAVDRVFHLLGLAFLEPRRGLSFCARKLRRLMVRSSLPRRRRLARPSRDHPDHAQTADPSLIHLRSPPSPSPYPAQELGTGVALSPHVGERPPPPRTLAIVVNDRDEAMDCLSSVASLLVWVAEAGIRNVSVYDQDGYVRASASRLAELVVKATMASDARGEGPPACTYVLRRADDVDGILRTTDRFACGGDATARRAASRRTSSRDGSGTGTGTESATTTVDLLWGGDGGAALVDAARRWGEGNGDIGDGDGDGDGDAGASDARGPTTPAALEAWMEARGSMLPNVDVMVVFGRHFHLSGYPPWQMHKAEIYHRPSLRGFTRKSLGEILRRYAGVSQRFGR